MAKIETKTHTKLRVIVDGIDYDLDVERIIIHEARALATKLNEEIEKGNDTSAFMIALMMAIFKDILNLGLDLSVVGLIPGVTFFLDLFLTAFLFFFMLGKGWFLKWKIKAGYWVLCGLVDGLPLVNALPINSLTVLYAWHIIRKRAANGKVKLRNLNKLSHREIRALNEDISLLESTIEKVE